MGEPSHFWLTAPDMGEPSIVLKNPFGSRNFWLRSPKSGERSHSLV
jgi:hypothetical protein